MAKSSFILLALAALLSHTASATLCTPGLTYCGGFLVSSFPDALYPDKITAELKSHGIAINSFNDYYSLFKCKDGDKIEYQSTCNNKCMDGGHGQSDFCDAQGESVPTSAVKSTATSGSSTPSSTSESAGKTSQANPASSAQATVGPTATPTPTGGANGHTGDENNSKNGPGGSKTNVGAIAGGAVGGVIIILLIGVVIILLRRKSARTSNPDLPPPNQMLMDQNSTAYGYQSPVNSNYPASPMSGHTDSKMGGYPYSPSNASPYSPPPAAIHEAPDNAAHELA